MRQRVYIICLLCLFIPFVHAQYVPDILGDGYLYRTIQMEDDYEGKVICTLIKKPALHDVKQAILYIHGYNDYFFQKELGDSIVAHGYNFYALDLRKYGRSLLPHQDAFFCKNISEYYTDIDTALAIIQSEENNNIILLAHSTGGLITPLYLDSHNNSRVKGIILNSPFLDMNMSPFVENIAIPIVAFIGKLFSRMIVMKKSSHSYAHSLLSKYKGEWEFNTDWKKVNGHPKRAGWINAIHQGHKKAQKKVILDCPILVLSSDKSYPESDTWNDVYSISDIVLDVKDIQKYGSRLSKNITHHTVPDGMHDLILSKPSARDYAYHLIFDWLNKLP